MVYSLSLGWLASAGAVHYLGYGARAVELVPVIIAFRAIPVICSFLVGWRCGRLATVKFVTLIAILATLAVYRMGLNVMVQGLAGYVYFALVSVSVVSFCEGYAERASRGAAQLQGRAPHRVFWHAAHFAVLFLFYVVVPAQMFARRSDAQLALVAWGWERNLAAYSYWNAKLRGGSTANLGADHSHFFLVASPELVFPGRGKRCSPSTASGLMRVLWGALILGLVAVANPLSMTHSDARGFGALVHTLVVGGASGLLWFYAAHSGLAHLQIGLCRMVGFKPPERYDFPVRASTPREFWARWNSYMAAWARVYVYSPIVRYLGAQRRLGAFGAGAAIVVTFACVGVLHDIYWTVINREVAHGSLIFFAAWGAILVACNFLEAAAQAGNSIVRIGLFRVGARAVVIATAMISANALLG